MIMYPTFLSGEAKAWVKRKSYPDEIIRIVYDGESNAAGPTYKLYVAYDENPDCLGRILFDAEGFWIYDGQVLTIAEQEQLAKFIINYVESVV
jgi:hypothetical protein